MSTSIERNDAWAALLRAELKAAWDGYAPSTALATPNDDQGDEPVYTLTQLDDIRAAARARIAAARITELPADTDDIAG